MTKSLIGGNCPTPGGAPVAETPRPAGRRRFLALFAASACAAVLPASAQQDAGEQDDLIYDRVIQKLVNDYLLKTNALTVEVKDAVVTVSGVVETEKLRLRVEKVVKKVKGVKSVVNQVRKRR